MVHAEPAGRAWSRMIILAATLLVALAGLRVTLSDSSWWVVGSLFLLLVLITTTLVRQLSRRVWLPTVAGGLVGVVGLTVGYGADTALFGVIPSPATLGHFAALGNDAWNQIAAQTIPATPELSIVFLIACTAIGVALLSDISLRIAPALTALPILTLLAVPVAVRPNLAEPFWFVLAAFGYLILLRVGRQRTTGSTVVVMGAVVVVGSFLVPAILPSVQQPADSSGVSGISTGVNPLINLGDDLRRAAPVTAVTYQTADSGAVYLRLATLANFDGRAWTPQLIPTTPTNSLAAFPAAAGLTAAVARTNETASVTVGGIQGQWLPVPYPTTRVTGTTGTWFWEPAGLSVRSTNTNVGGQKYTASFIAVHPDLTQLRAATTDPVASHAYLQLPAGLPKIISDTATAVAGSAATNYDKAIALQNYFTSPLFTYSTTAPVAQGYDGTGADVVAEFLQKKAGYCVHFASAMAIMARVLGIPSRVAVGFQPGVPSIKNGKTVYTVTTHDLHAWPELYFDGIGWLRFEPTPGRGALPDYSVPAAVDQLPSAAPTSAATGAAAATATPTANAGRTLPSDAASSPAAGASRGVDATPLVALIVLLIILGAGLSPLIARTAVRWRREMAIANGREPAVHAWAEVRDTARDHGWAAPDTETAREFAARLARVLDGDSSVIADFRGQVETTAYGRPDAAPLRLHELRALRRAIARSVAPGVRLRAIFLPASMIARVRADPGRPG
ncbi:MAG: transglutaminase domain-containing protein [Acidobacteria bacterium]|nr:transglutaminase domain-containing protein [Acidobacteriota bacterium]